MAGLAAFDSEHFQRLPANSLPDLATPTTPGP